MTDYGVNFHMSLSEAWELVGYLATSRNSEFIELSERLEKQLKEIEKLKTVLGNLQKEYVDGKNVKKSRE